jgi:hypothetical protein
LLDLSKIYKPGDFWPLTLDAAQRISIKPANCISNGTSFFTTIKSTNQRPIKSAKRHSLSTTEYYPNYPTIEPTINITIDTTQ